MEQCRVTHEVTTRMSGIDCSTPAESQILNHHHVYDNSFELLKLAKASWTGKQR